MSTIPFTYCLHHKPTGKRYYGVHWKQNCHPDDLWNIYFSSSTIVKNLIKEYGKESFDFSIRRIFDDPRKAVRWEQRVLRRLKVDKNDEWINRAYMSEHCICVMTDEIKKKLSDINMGKTIPLEQIERMKANLIGQKRTEKSKKKMSELQIAAGGYGPKKHSEETKEKIGAAQRGKPKTEEHKRKMSESAKIQQQNRRDNGWKMSEESKKRISESKTGKRLSNEHSEKIRERRKGTKRHYLPDGSFTYIKS